VPEEIEGRAVEVDFGRHLYLQNCSSCHGVEGTGMPKQGANLRDSYFVRRKSNEQLVSFLRIGRMPADRDTVLGLTMPPRGGNADLDDGELCDIVAYLRQVQWSHGSRPQARARAVPSLLGSANADSGPSRRY
jgi:mono/diheme cytochrome c family protein